MKVDRKKLEHQLRCVSPGLSLYEVLEQSTCFVFMNEHVFTYNDDIACSCKTELGKLKGAVQARPLLNLISKMKEEQIDIEIKGEELIVTGKKKKAGFRLEAKIELPVDKVEQPSKWKKLSEDFEDAIKAVENCVSRDASKFKLTCLHFHPKWIEAADGYAAARYTINTRVKKPLLVRNISIQYIPQLSMTHLSETKEWLHFKNGSGLILSCRKYNEDFEDLSKILKIKGEPLVLPKTIKQSVQRAEVMATENTLDEVVIKIKLKPNIAKIIGIGSIGWFNEIKKVKYKGRELSFTLPPKLLLDLLTRHSKCEVTKDKLKATGPNLVYVTSLGSE